MKIGISQTSLADIETGRRAVTVEQTLQLIELYGIPFSAVDVRGMDPARALVSRGRGRPRAKDFEATSKVSPPELRQEAERRLQDAEEAFRLRRIEEAGDHAREALSMVVADAGWRVGRLPGRNDSFAVVLAHLDSYRAIAEVGQFVMLVNSTGLWAATARSNLDTPLLDSTPASSVYANERRNLAEIDDLIAMIEGLG